MRSSLSLALTCFGLIILAFAPQCVSRPKASISSPAWISDMHRLSDAHLQLMPLVWNAEHFSDPSNRNDISKKIQAFVVATGPVVKNSANSETDPLIDFSGARFGQEVRQAYKAFQMDDLEWSRHSLNRATGYCVSCHTRADRGRDFEISWMPQLAALNAPQKIEFMLANRRYTTALDEAKRMAMDPIEARRDSRGWVIAIERVLAMLIRVRGDNAQAQDLAHMVIENRSAPSYLKNAASAWLRDLENWQLEKRKFGDIGLEKAIHLITQANSYGTASNDLGLVLNLRASAILHQILESPKSPNYGEALLNAGIVSKSLNYLNLGLLDQYYYERCIYFSPHSELARRCFDRLEESAQESALPADLDPDAEYSNAAHMAELKGLSQPDQKIEPTFGDGPDEMNGGGGQ